MKGSLLERTPVNYTQSATKVLHFHITPHKNCFRLHWHDRMELLYISQGKIHLDHGVDHLIASEGELVIIPPKVLHKGYTLNDSVEYTVLMFDVRYFYNETELCKSLLPAILDGRAVFHPITKHKETIQCVKKLCINKTNETLETIGEIYQLLFLLYKNALFELRKEPANADSKKIINFIEDNASNDLNIEILSKRFGYTPAHLCRKFKKSTGLSPMNYLKIYRLETAHNMLKNDTSSIGDIAAECGFSDANYFTRCFKKHFGISPMQYRHSLKN